MNILVVNCGSSTIKFQVVALVAAGKELYRPQTLAWGLVDRVGGDAICTFSSAGGERFRDVSPIENHGDATEKIVSWLASIPGPEDNLSLGLDAVGHRVVHGGDEFTAPVLIDDKVIARIEALNDLAPLHNPAAVSGIRAAREVLGDSMPMVASFDTSFHHTIPKHAAIYAIPDELSRRYKIRRYGFHGLAHQYDVARYAELTGKNVDQVSAVTLHLGNGCSATAIRHGQSIDTSMGFTPLEGLVMGTRSGDLDPALVSYLARKEHVDAAEIDRLLNQRSGLLGISGLSNDMRELIAAYPTNPRARLAVDVFCHRARKYLGAYLAVLEGKAEAVIFSGGIGENAATVRRIILGGMAWCGVNLDEVANQSVLGRDGQISALDSQLDVFVIHTDEESMIARETLRLVAGG